MWKFLNVHPQGKRVDDCVKRAITLVTQMDYNEVKLELNRYKKVTGAKEYNERKNCIPYVEKVLGMIKMSFPAETGKPRMNGERFCKAYPKGRYILNMAGHWTACVDGVIYDTWDCTEKCVYNAWKMPSKKDARVKEIREEYSTKIRALQEEIKKLEKEMNNKINAVEKEVE